MRVNQTNKHTHTQSVYVFICSFGCHKSQINNKIRVLPSCLTLAAMKRVATLVQLPRARKDKKKTKNKLFYALDMLFLNIERDYHLHKYNTTPHTQLQGIYGFLCSAIDLHMQREKGFCCCY